MCVLYLLLPMEHARCPIMSAWSMNVARDVFKSVTSMYCDDALELSSSGTPAELLMHRLKNVNIYIHM